MPFDPQGRFRIGPAHGSGTVHRVLRNKTGRIYAPPTGDLFVVIPAKAGIQSRRAFHSSDFQKDNHRGLSLRPEMRTDRDAPPYRNGRFPNRRTGPGRNRPCEGGITRPVGGAYMRPARRNRQNPRICPHLPLPRKEAKKVTFELKRARLTIKRASFSCFFRRFENVSIRVNSKRIQGVFKRIHALSRTHNRLIQNEKRRNAGNFI